MSKMGEKKSYLSGSLDLVVIDCDSYIHIVNSNRNGIILLVIEYDYIITSKTILYILLVRISKS